MNTKNAKLHNSVDDSLEVFTPFPAYQDYKLKHKNGWFQFFKELIHTKH